jgi:integrase
MPKKVAFRLTAQAVKTHRKIGLLADGLGLYLQTRRSTSKSAGPKSVVKSWIFRYRFGGKAWAHGLGSVDTVGLEQARSEALRCRQLLREGVNPTEERKRRLGAAIAEQAISKTFRQTAEAFIEANESGWRNLKHAKQWRSTLEAHCFPKMGNVPVQQVQTAHVLACIEPIWREKPETASRLRGRIEQVLDFAKARELRNGENPARWKGHLDQALPARGSVAPIVHHEAMPYPDLPPFYAQLVKQEGVGPLALQFLILTCARTNEVVGAEWSEIDLARRMWIVPPERMKAKREWRVPLSRESIAILRSLDQSTAFVFPGRKSDSQLSNMTLLQLTRRMGLEAVPHGFRSTFRDWAAETQHFAHEVVEMALAHAVGSKVELAYRRTDLLEKRRELAQAWADFATSKLRRARVAA